MDMSNQNPTDGDADDYYSDAAPSATADQANSQGSAQSTALIAKSVFRKELAPGATVSMRVVRVHENEYEVECSRQVGELQPPKRGPLTPMLED